MPRELNWIDGGVRVQERVCEECENPISVGRGQCELCNVGPCCVRFVREGYCEHCAELDENVCVIQPCSSRRYPVRRCGANELAMGVELEIECKNGDQESVAELIHRSFKDYLLLKQDGSLRNGIELVTGQLSLLQHQMLWPRVSSLLRTMRGVSSWRSGRCGQHVHLSRNHFSELQIAKYSFFLNHRNTRYFIDEIAGRKRSDYARYNPKTAMKKCQFNESRYAALNTSNSATIEVRIFRGTLSSHAVANIEFCHSLATWIVETMPSISECSSPEIFLNWAKSASQKNQYKHFLTYLKKRGI